jgi:hypothetical protein
MFEGRIELMKAADHEISDKAVKELSMLSEQSMKSIKQRLTGLIS